MTKENQKNLFPFQVRILKEMTTVITADSIRLLRAKVAEIFGEYGGHPVEEKYLKLAGRPLQHGLSVDEVVDFLSDAFWAAANNFGA